MPTIEQVQDIFEEALVLPLPEREAFVRHKCGDDAAVADQVLALLATGQDSNGYLDRLFQGVAHILEEEQENSPTRLGHYRLEEKLGEGGMGLVYKAWDEKLQRHVAIKILQGLRAGNPAEKARFAQEAKAAARLNHRYVCEVFEIGQAPQGELYIVNAFCPGEDLGKVIASKQPSLGNILGIMGKLCEAMQAAHNAGIYHRDLKPANVIVDENLDIKLVDFGIAKISGQDISRTGQILGTLAYMAPEQFSAGNIDQRTDIWSLGVLLYFALTGERPFAGDNPAAVMYQLFHADTPQIKIDALPFAERFNHIFRRTINLDKHARFASCKLLADELRFIQESLDGVQQADFVPRHDSQTSVAATLSGSEISERRSIIAMAVHYRAQNSGQTDSLRKEIKKCIRHFSGQLNECTEKCCLAFFGFPLLGEGAADHALSCALTLARLPNIESPTTVRVTLDRVPALFQDDKTSGRKRMVSDLAGPLQPIVSHGTGHPILISESVRQKLRKPLAPSHVHEIVDQDSHTYLAIDKLDGILAPIRQRFSTPLLGRVHELGILEAAWNSVSEGEARVALISGEAGMGKTRLVYELCRTLRRRDEFTLFECQADPNQRDRALHPVTNALRAYLVRIKTRRDLDSLPTALQHWLDGLGLDSRENRAALAWLLGIEVVQFQDDAMRESPEAMQRKCLAILESCIQSLAKRKPLLLIVEDLHWADLTTLEWIDRLLSGWFFPAVFLVMTGRPELFARMRAYSTVTQLPLNRLKQSESRELVQSFYLTTQLSAEAEKKILEKGAGNPLFVEEYTRMLLQRKDQHDSTKEGVPENLADLVYAQLDHLGAGKIVAQTASIIGREFNSEILAKLLNSPLASLEQHLYTLSEIGTIFRRGQHNFLFKHALVRDALYDSIAAEHRRLLHRAFAQVLTEDDDHTANTAETIARHYAAADDQKLARHWWIQAAQAAQGLYVVNETIRLCHRALDTLAQDNDTQSNAQDELKTLMMLGPALIAASNYANREVGSVYSRALELSEKLKQTDSRFTAMMGLWSHRCVSAHHREASTLAASLVEQAEQANSNDLRVEAYLARGATALFMAEFDTASHDLAFAIQCYREDMSATHIRLYGQDPAMAIYTFQALLEEAQGRGDEAKQCSAHAIEAGRRSGHPFSLGYALAFAFHIYLRQHDARTAAALRAEYQTLCQKQDIHVFNLLGALQEGLIVLSRGDVDGGIALIEAAIPPYQDFGTGVFLATWWGILAMAYLQKKALAKSRECLKKAHEEMESSGEYLQKPLLLMVEKQLAQSGSARGES